MFRYIASLFTIEKRISLAVITASLVATIVVAFVALLSLSFFNCDDVIRIPFSSAEWKGDIGADHPGKPLRRAIGDLRHGMLNDLTKNILKTTMTKDDIEKLLGLPDEVVGEDKKYVYLYAPNHNVVEYWYYEIWGACTFCAHFYVGFDDKGFYVHHYVKGQ